MFHERALNKTKIFLYIFKWIGQLQNYATPYMFFEELADIVNPHGTPYEPNAVSNATGQIIRIGMDQSTRLLYPNAKIMILLQKSLKFRLHPHKKTNVLGLEPIFLGEYDISVLPFAHVPTGVSLLPTVLVEDQIYVTDLAMKGSPTYFIDIFSATLWLSLLISFAFVGFIINLGHFVLKQFKIFSPDNFNWFATIVNQGSHEIGNLIHQKVVLVSLSILLIIFHGSFESFMSSSLAIRVPDLPFSNLDGLLQSKDYSLCIVTNTIRYLEVVERKSKVQINPKRCPKFINNVLGKPTDLEIQCPNGKLAYIGFGTYWDPQLEKNCKLKTIDGKYFGYYVQMVVSPGFKYREQFNRKYMRIIQILSAGHVNHLNLENERKAYFLFGVQRGAYKNMATTTDIERTIAFQQVVIIFAFLFSAIFAAVVILVIEIAVKKLSH